VLIPSTTRTPSGTLGFAVEDYLRLVNCARRIPNTAEPMTDRDLQTLKDNNNRVVRIKTHDGEVLLAKVIFASDLEQDLIYDLVATSRESQYEKRDVQSKYLIPFKDIESVEAVHRE
jgi:hypothetical protein